MIHPAIAQHIPAIRDLCREYGIQRLEIFGSSLTEHFNPARSDVDFLVTYPPCYEFGPWGQRVFELQDALAEIVGRDVDLIMSDAPGTLDSLNVSIGPERRFSVHPASQALLEDLLRTLDTIDGFINDQSFADYENNTMITSYGVA